MLVLLGLLVSWSSLQLSRHVVTLGACDRPAAELLCGTEMLSGELASWILSLWQGGPGAVPGQSWGPASPVLLTIFLLPQELLAFALPHHDLCSVGRGDLAGASHHKDARMEENKAAPL